MRILVFFLSCLSFLSASPRAFDPFKKLEQQREIEEAKARWEVNEGTVLFRVKVATGGRQALTVSQLNIEGIESLRRMFPTASPPKQSRATSVDTEEQSPDLTRWMLAELKEGVDPRAIVTQLMESTSVESAELDYIYRLSADGQYWPMEVSDSTEGMESPVAFAENGIPDSTTDPLLSQQWHLDAAKVKDAWTYLNNQGLPAGGSSDIVVAVIDSGVDYTHPDLVANMWVNSQEVPNNGQDDDGNGIVDDYHGASFLGSSFDHSGDPMDDNGHGTHVAGIIAATAGNGIGGVGVAYNAKVMAIKAAQYSGILTSSDIAESLYYAVENGADIINMSFGGSAQSTIVEDALAAAFSQAVLVAAAGNNSRHTEIPPSNPLPQPMFPAAYINVLGIMAEAQSANSEGEWLASFSNWDSVPNSRTEYELMAPGVGIQSTLPDGKYAAWSGTSMSAPIVSGMAALVRSRFADKSTYSSRFVMGQIAATGAKKTGKAPVALASKAYYTADSEQAVSSTPEPDLTFLELWVFDDPAINPANDGDGIADAGETIELAVVIKNRWGKAEATSVTLSAQATGAVDVDPYVTWGVDTVDYGAIGNFGEDDNGLIYDADGLITGVANPFQFSISNDAPNNHVIPITITMTCGNGFDDSDPGSPYSFTGSFNLTVQKGTTLPSIFESDTILDKNTYWIVDRPVLIPEGITVTITEGTQIQFWSADTNEPYTVTPYPFIQVEGKLIIQGTADKPASLFPSDFRKSHPVCIFEEQNGVVEMEYFKILNPLLGKNYGNITETASISRISHAYFTQWGGRLRTPGGDSLSAYINSDLTQYSHFQHLGAYEYYSYNPTDPYTGFALVLPDIRNSLVDSTRFSFGLRRAWDGHQGIWQLGGSVTNSVFLRNYVTYLNGGNLVVQPAISQIDPTHGFFDGGYLQAASLTELGQKTYVGISFQSQSTSNASFVDGDKVSFYAAQSLARQLGGNIATIDDESEAALLTTWMEENFLSDAAFYSKNPDGDRRYFPFARGIIGYNDTDGDRIFDWIDGSASGYLGVLEQVTPSDTAVYTYLSESGFYFTDKPYNKFAILELPLGTTLDDIESARSQIYEDIVGISGSAILNEWWRGNTQYWLRVLGKNNPYQNPPPVGKIKYYMRNNYYGTQSTELLENMFLDYNTDFTRMDIVWEPTLAEAPEACWPFVVDIVLSTESDPDASVVGAERVTFTVSFNRDMDTGIQPTVSFGPDIPITDYSINPVNGGWSDERTWVGTFTISAITGDGYQLIRVSDAVAADDPWLVNGNDAGRFRFEIVTSGTEALTLQATGGEGYVDLSWSQDDFELLAGYNVYRALSSDGTFQRINTSVIPSDETTFRDVMVQPGQTYFYKFKVVLTDMSESSESNTVQGTALDTLIPVISHALTSNVQPNLPLTLIADITDNISVASATLYYRPIGTTNYTSRSMIRTLGDRWSVTLEASIVSSPGIEYYITASDGQSAAFSARPDQPYSLQVEDKPVQTALSPAIGPAAGGTVVTISGSNFKAGATVRFGGIPATNITVVNSTQITATAPAHGPAIVSVVVENPDGASSTLSNAFTYSQNLTLYLPEASGQVGTILTTAVDSANVSGLVALDLALSYDASILEVISVSAGSALTDWSFLSNSNTSGEIVVSGASVNPLSGSGALVELTFRIIGDPNEISALTFTNATLNDGAIASTLVDGSVTVAPYSAVSGQVTYRGDTQRPIENATLSLLGPGFSSTVTDTSGGFIFAQLINSSYSLKPTFSTVGSAITAYDAALTLQHAVGLQTLTGHAAIAADVNRNGSINSMDVYNILRHAAGLADISLVAGGTAWVFEPAQRQYAQMNTVLTEQDFSATLLGDVSGNWNAATQQSGESIKLGINTVVDYRGDRTIARVFMQSPIANVLGMDLVLAYEPVAVPSEITAQTFTGAINDQQAGEIRAALASSQGVSGDKAFLKLQFPGTENLALRIVSASINEGSILVDGPPSMASFDADGDGLLDADETELLGTRTDSSDSDNDGLSDRDEVFAGTDPLDANSGIRAVLFKELIDGSLEVSWDSIPGRWYVLEKSSEITNNWEAFGQAIQATSAMTLINVSQPEDTTRVFYRIRVLE